MGLMAGFLGGIGKGLADSSKMYLDNEFEAMKAERIAEAQSSIRMRDDLTMRERNVADAAAERARVDTEAQAMADKRGAGLAEGAKGAYRGLMAADPSGAEAGLKAVADAEQAGGYRQEPTDRDRMRATGQYDKLAAMEAADAARSDTRTDREADNARADKELSLRQKQEARLAGVAASESRLKEIQIGQAVEVETQRKRMMDKTLPEAQRIEAKELYQVLSGKDADKFEIIKTKDDLGREVVLGRQNTKTGQFEKFNGDSFGGAAPAGGNKVSAKVIQPPPAAIADLLAGRGSDASFDKHFGAGKAAEIRADAAKEGSKKSAVAGVDPLQYSKYLVESNKYRTTP